ncbi:unnamed protein product [Cyprideis torosa]|uniref:Uncharacterized protein n=1 Tax=Cyprideis torosa TaxID=163714 RepID=A0A7R8ZNX5_9CRUS|nr:unnamed protein product [Cyprideis torosa]CAG0887368.1 unnamed protein product [Cyprideis torosa]
MSLVLPTSPDQDQKFHLGAPPPKAWVAGLISLDALGPGHGHSLARLFLEIVGCDMSHHQASHDDNQLCDPDELAGLNYGTAKLQISTPSPHSPEKAILDPPRNISINGCISNSSNGMDCSIPYSLAPRSASNSDRGRPLTRRSVDLYQKPPAYLGQGLEGEESPTEKLGKDYFAMRNGAWLLTQIDHWDHEKERLILLSSHSILILNHNFISLETSWISRIPIEKLEKVIIGPLVYPEKSIVP